MEPSKKTNFVAGLLLGFILSVIYFFIINSPSYILIKIFPPLEKLDVVKVNIAINGLDISFTDFDEEGEKVIKIPIDFPSKYELTATFTNGHVVSGQSGLVRPGYILYENISEEKIVHRIRAK
ncbi:hypothetical protein [Agarivorans sp. JK6]|uniref:hypothetical protein n=1 Tax=Agarivorans sp. JK6 TaxID=2997426 RepID=UPI003873567D